MVFEFSPEVIDLLSRIEEIDLEKYRVIGKYTRFDVSIRNSLKDFRVMINSSIGGDRSGIDNFLIWGSPGSGKSFLVNQVVRSIGSDISYFELNLASLKEQEFRKMLDDAEQSSKPTVCFVDEVDSKSNDSWPYEVLIPYLEPSRNTSHRIIYVLAGSWGNSMDEMKGRIESRSKGKDLLSRVLKRNEFTIPPLSVGDRVVVAVSQMIESSREREKSIREIEKMALLYTAVNPNFSSARELRSLAVSCANRIPLGEDRIKYDYLFAPGDVESKEFWAAAKQKVPSLVESYVSIEIGKEQDTKRVEERKEKRIAVLPFTNMSSDPEEDYFADGMTEELITSLSGIRQLTVIARTSIMGYKGTTKKVRDIGKELGVGYLLEGSVRKAGNRVRVTAQLVDTSTEGHLWAQNYDRQLEDVFSIQSEIAEKVARELRIRLVEEERRVISKRATENSDAYTMYLRGRQLVGERTEPSIRQALEVFEQAIALDQSFAKAYAGMASCYSMLANDGYEADERVVPKAELAVKKALQLDPELAEAHAILSQLNFSLDDVEGSEAEAKRAIELNPSLPEAYWALSSVYFVKGEIDEGIKASENCYRLDPLMPFYVARLGAFYFYIGRENDALNHWKKTVSLAPAATYRDMTEYYLYKGDLDSAKRYHSMAEKLEPTNRWVTWMRGFIAAQSGDRSGALEAIKEIERKWFGIVNLNEIGFIHYALGDLDSYFEYINRANDQHVLQYSYVFYCPLFAEARKDPRYGAILKEFR